MRIFTHVKPDLDALFSVIAARWYIPGARNARIEFRPASWDGVGMDDGDIAVDMEAGGRGMKGHRDDDGTTHSCFALIMTKYAPTGDCLALASIIEYVDTQDAHGNVAKHIIPDAPQETRNMISATSLSARISWLMAIHKNNIIRIIERLEEDFRGMLIVGYRRLATEEEISDVELFADGKVALVINKGKGVTYALYEKGVRVVVFINRYGMGITREQTETLRMDHPEFLKVVEAAGEEIGEGDDKWFAHTAGFLFASGTPKSPSAIDSKVDPRALVDVAVKLLS